MHTSFILRVAPEDGQPEFESRLSAWGNDANRLRPGRWTYVLYDPDHPDRCELDKDRLAKEFEPLYDHKHRVMVPKDVSAAWFKTTATVGDPLPPPNPASGDIVGDLSRLGDLRAAGTLTEAEFAAAKSRLLGQGGSE
jgi:Short C-terminal domain